MSEPKPKKARADAIEYEQRLIAVQVWVIEGYSASIILKQIMDKGWSLSTRHAQRMLAAARKKWVQDEDDDIKQQRQLKVQQLQHLKRTLGDKYKGTPEGIKAVVAVEKEIIKLMGIAAPVKLEHTGKDGEPIQMETKSNVDYSKLSSEILRDIVNARIKTVA